MVEQPPFQEFVKLVKRKIRNDSRMSNETKDELLDDVEGILNDDFFDDVSKEILLLNMLRRVGIPVGVEGGAIRILRRQRRHLYRR
jgi:hypothetical protein